MINTHKAGCKLDQAHELLNLLYGFHAQGAVHADREKENQRERESQRVNESESDSERETEREQERKREIDATRIIIHHMASFPFSGL